jgi:hypothetical protein
MAFLIFNREVSQGAVLRRRGLPFTPCGSPEPAAAGLSGEYPLLPGGSMMIPGAGMYF